MIRTQKGARPPGWELWTNRHEKQMAKADYRDPEPDLVEEARVEEIDEALYCHFYGPCARCASL